MKDKVFVEVLRELEPEEGIAIKVGALGILHVGDTTTGWPVFESYDQGHKWDIAIENDELKNYFKVIKSAL